MKIAIPNNNGNVNQHFGRSESFAIVEIDANQKTIVDSKVVSAQQLQHNHSGLAGLLKTEGVETVLVGGIGAGAIAGLEAQGLQVLFGASGAVEEVALSFAKGNFESTRVVCEHHGEHHHQ